MSLYMEGVEASGVHIKPDPHTFSNGMETFESRNRRASSPLFSCISMKSNESIGHPPNLGNEVVPAHHIDEIDFSKPLKADLISTGSLETDNRQQRVKMTHKTLMKTKYGCLFEGTKVQESKTLLNSIYTQLYILEGNSEGVNEEHEVVKMERKPKRKHFQDIPIYCNDIFKPSLEPECGQKRRNSEGKDRIVVTQGIAGIGKTVSVQKFILDWAEETANQDVDFMFVLPFRELNLIQDERYCLQTLLLVFHPELQDLDLKIYEECKVVLIFDGLDESRIPLNFSEIEKVSNVSKTSSVGVIVSNLIKGDLLPSAQIWITSRPAATRLIPSPYINRMTEIQGFNDAQKEEYFRKSIRDEHLASRIISHVKRVRSLHIMCHIPVFCWISSTVLQKILEHEHSAEIPKTLTEMYIHFLLIQINLKNEKYNPDRDQEELLQSSREVIVKLAELAYKQLMEGYVMFHEDDLRECGIDITDASLYSGICTEIFREESVIHQRKIYSFIHLSFQEFLAAFYAFYHYIMKSSDKLQFFDIHSLYKGAVDKALHSENGDLDLFLRFLLGISLESNQRLLQNLLTHTENTSDTIRTITQYIKDKIKDYCGLSADRSISLFLCLLEVNDQTLYRELAEFERSDGHSKKLSPSELSPGLCSAIAYMIQMSEEVQDELNLNKYNTTLGGKLRLIPAVMNCKKAILAGCNLSEECYKTLDSALQSSNSQLEELDLSNNDLQNVDVNFGHHQLKKLRLAICNLNNRLCGDLASTLASDSCLRELDLGNNDLQDLGVKLLCFGLKNPNCQLEILRLSGCMVTEEGCAALASALKSNPSHMRELDLSYNHPGDSGIKILSDLLEDPHCKLSTLNVDHVGEAMIKAGLYKYACDLPLDPNTVNPHLCLSEKNTRVTRSEMKQESYSDHPERFDYWPQVMSGEIQTDRCYWEAEWSGWRGAVISVTYKGINKKGGGEDCRFGFNENSWSLDCTYHTFTAWHNKKSTDVAVPLKASNRVAVYLDFPAGTLSFYSVSDELTHIHTFHPTFTEPLCAGFRIYTGSSISLSCFNIK